MNNLKSQMRVNQVFFVNRKFLRICDHIHFNAIRNPNPISTLHLARVLSFCLRDFKRHLDALKACNVLFFTNLVLRFSRNGVLLLISFKFKFPRLCTNAR